MHDAIELEARGLPTAVIVTSEFVREAKVQREALGMGGLVPVVIAHPLSSLTDEEIRARAAAALPQVLAAWQGKLRDVAP
ncbi:MAG TPA: hypothetical protein VE935_23490 [Burkholderiales bacterium]|jgi:hypothetical protein|nr:hypothetical protein [Burkholderiales bacterium]